MPKNKRFFVFDACQQCLFDLTSDLRVASEFFSLFCITTCSKPASTAILANSSTSLKESPMVRDEAATNGDNNIVLTTPPS
jgi:hypothetical protein